MIIGDYYINNFLVAVVVLGFLGGGIYLSGSMVGSPQNQDSGGLKDLEIAMDETELEAGNDTALNVFNSEGDSVEQVEVFIDGSKVGETDEEGFLRVSVPRSGFTVRASKNNVESTRDFGREVIEGLKQEDEESSEDQNSTTEENDSDQDTGSEGIENDTSSGESEDENFSINDSEEVNDTGGFEPSVNISMLRPSDGESVGTYRVDFNFSASSNVQGSYDLVVDGSIIDLGDIREGENYVEASFSLGSEGSHTWQVMVETDGGEQFNSEQREFMLDPSEQESGKEEVERVISFEPENAVPGYEPTFRFDVNNSGFGAESYTVNLDGSEFFTGGLEEGLQSFEQEKIVHEGGDHSWTVNLVENGEEVFSSDATSFSTGKDSPPINLSLESPETGSTVEGTELSFNVSVNSPYDYRFMLYTDNEVRYNSSLHNEQEPPVITRTMQESGEHTWYVEAYSKETEELFSSEERTFETTEDTDFATVDLVRPDDGASGDPGGEGVQFDYEIEAFEPVNYEMVIDGSVAYSSELEEGYHDFSKVEGLSEGDHTWFVRVESGGESIKSEERSLTVQ